MYDKSDLYNIDKLVEMYDKSGGFKFSWKRIRATLVEENGSAHNRQMDAICQQMIVDDIMGFLVRERVVRPGIAPVVSVTS